LVLLAVTSLSLWPRAEAQHPNPDPNGRLVVYLSASHYTVGEGDGQVIITVLLSAASSQTVTVDYATADGTATGYPNDNRPCDYRSMSGVLHFAPGETTKTVTILVLQDCQIEANETFTLALSNSMGAGLGTIASSLITILDDDS
jgi:hypothetical protein